MEPLDLEDKIRVHLVRERRDTAEHTNSMLSRCETDHIQLCECQCLTFNLFVVRIRYRMFSDSDEGGGDRRWSELRTDLLAVEERTPGWLPDIQLAALLRTNMQVGVQSMQRIFPVQKVSFHSENTFQYPYHVFLFLKPSQTIDTSVFSVWRDGEARDRDAGHLRDDRVPGQPRPRHQQEGGGRHQHQVRGGENEIF